MTTISKVLLSGCTDGKLIQITSTGGTGQAIHTAHATAYDELFITACNNHTAAVDLTIQIGGTTSDKTIKISLNPAEGLVIIIPGLPLTNSVAVTAIASVTAVVNIMGHVLRAT